MRKPHIHADVIKAWADGAQIQYRFMPDRPWEDIEDPTWIPDDEYRVKPENVVRYVPIMKTPRQRYALGYGVTSAECAKMQSDEHHILLNIVRIEIDPKTCNLIGANTVDRCQYA